jgi:predicted RND superfamily exporter protein
VTTELKFESSYLALLPENAPEVAAIHEVKKYTGGTAELVIAVGGKEKNRLPFAKKLAARLNKTQLVKWAQVEFPVGFFEQNGL